MFRFFQSSEKHAFKTHVDSLAKDNATVTSAAFYTQGDGEETPLPTTAVAKGRMTADALRAIVGEEDFGAAAFYVCGPAAFMDGVIELLRGAGVEEARINYETFGPGK